MAKTDKKKKIFTIPNILTFVRLLMTPVFFIMYQKGYITGSLVVYILALFTDVIDGIIARVTESETYLGQILDPFADKLMTLCVVGSFTSSGIVADWIFILFLSSFIVLMLGSLFLLSKNIVVKANVFGKISAFFVFAGIIACYFSKLIAPWHQTVLMVGLFLFIFAVIYYIAIYSAKLKSAIFKK